MAVLLVQGEAERLQATYFESTFKQHVSSSTGDSPSRVGDNVGFMLVSESGGAHQLNQIGGLMVGGEVWQVQVPGVSISGALYLSVRFDLSSEGPSRRDIGIGAPQPLLVYQGVYVGGCVGTCDFRAVKKGECEQYGPSGHFCHSTNHVYTPNLPGMYRHCRFLHG